VCLHQLIKSQGHIVVNLGSDAKNQYSIASDYPYHLIQCRLPAVHGLAAPNVEAKSFIPESMHLSYFYIKFGLAIS
jgi:hypothetical protein